MKFKDSSWDTDTLLGKEKGMDGWERNKPFLRKGKFWKVAEEK